MFQCLRHRPIVGGDKVSIEIDGVGRMDINVVQGKRGRNFILEKTLTA